MSWFSPKKTQKRTDIEEYINPDTDFYPTPKTHKVTFILKLIDFEIQIYELIKNPL